MPILSDPDNAHIVATVVKALKTIPHPESITVLKSKNLNKQGLQFILKLVQQDITLFQLTFEDFEDKENELYKQICQELQINRHIQIYLKGLIENKKYHFEETKTLLQIINKILNLDTQQLNSEIKKDLKLFLSEVDLTPCLNGHDYPELAKQVFAQMQKIGFIQLEMSQLLKNNSFYKQIEEKISLLEKNEMTDLILVCTQLFEIIDQYQDSLCFCEKDRLVNAIKTALEVIKKEKWLIYSDSGCLSLFFCCHSLELTELTQLKGQGNKLLSILQIENEQAINSVNLS